MQTLMNLALKLSGLGWLWTKVDGVKTYVAATVSILTGLLGLIQEFQTPLFAHNAGALWHLVKALPQDQSWALVVAGLGVLGLRHSIAKQTTP